MSKLLKLLLSSVVISVMFVACQSGEVERDNQTITQSPATPTKAVKKTDTGPEQNVMKTMTPKQTATLIITATRTSSPTPSPTHSWITWTPQSPEPLPTIKVKVKELMTKNSGCQLPCWWGIELGKTKFSDAIKDLSPLAIDIWIKETGSPDSLVADISFPVPDSISPYPLSQYYLVENDIIQQLEVVPGHVDRYLFSRLIQENGEPKEVWVEGIIDPTSNNPFWIFFYYPDKGISAVFQLEASNLGEVMRLCPVSEPPTTLVLWRPTEKDNFIDFAGKTNTLKYLKEEKRVLVSLREATNLTLEEISERGCFDTPKNIWTVR